MSRHAAVAWIEKLAQTLGGATAIVVVGVAVIGTGLGQRDDTPGARQRAAMRSYEAQLWPQAFAQFAELADAGDPAAARVAAMMVRQGPRVFGQRFDVEPQRLARWDLAMRGESLHRPRPALVETTETLPAQRLAGTPVVAAAVGTRDGRE